MDSSASRRANRPFFLSFTWWITCTALLYVAGVCAPARAQEPLQLWLSAGVDGRVYKRLKLQYDQQLRFTDNVHSLSEWLNDFGVEVRVTKWLELATAYRLIYRPDKDGDKRCCRQRILGDGNFETKVGVVKLGARVRLQARFEKDDDTVSVARLRLLTELRLWKPVRPYVSVEGFATVLAPGPPLSRKLRITAGSRFRVRRPGGLVAFYRVEIPADRQDAVQYIFGLGGSMSLGKKKKKAKNDPTPELPEVDDETELEPM